MGEEFEKKMEREGKKNLKKTVRVLCVSILGHQSP